ncbi:MIP/aquaporin family protein [uncultured Tenacibaculum sp.]|uniref:MIP/aquaporin family protein n=1 Tax=uncultured Tenacibaculum sp. TaxID=174713 RepID=UPI00262FA63C|nr:MIP/aquaporin family protein [uncultured Tenacibaculum sp.]
MRKYIAEFIGTFTLVFCGTGAVIVNSLSEGSLGLLGISAAFGIVIMGIIYVFGAFSGAHINPAVTIALAVGKLIPKREVIHYVIAQVLGAFLASVLLYLIFAETQTLGETLPSGGVISSFVLETVLTFFLMLTILGVTSQKDYSCLAGIVIGVFVTGIILIAGPISGGSFNPARSLAPAVLSGNIHSLWIYIIAPILGSVLAMLLWKFMVREE